MCLLPNIQLLYYMQPCYCHYPDTSMLALFAAAAQSQSILVKNILPNLARDKIDFHSVTVIGIFWELPHKSV